MTAPWEPEVRRAVADGDWPWREAGTLVLVKELLDEIDALRGWCETP